MPPAFETLERRTLFSAGALDPTFSAGGIAAIGRDGPYDAATRSAALTADGKTVVFGQGNNSLRLARYNADGSPDVSFGTAGVASVPLLTTPSALYNLSTMVIGGDGKIILAGSWTAQPETTNGDSLYDFAFERLDADGSVDSTFGNGGFQSIAFGGHTSTLSAVAVDAAGDIVAAGYAYDRKPYGGDQTFSRVAIARLRPDGSADPEFGIDGQSVFSYDRGRRGPTAYSQAAALALQPDGRIVVAGTLAFSLSAGGYAAHATANRVAPAYHYPDPFNGQTPNTWAAARLDANGRLDPTFGSGGTSVLTARGDAGASAVAIGAGGKIVLGGWGPVYTRHGRMIAAQRFTVVRLTTVGRLDPTFAGGGVDPLRVNGQIESLALGTGGNIFAAGSTRQSSLSLVHLTPDGTFDRHFGTRGAAHTAPLGRYYEPTAAALLARPGGKIELGVNEYIGTDSTLHVLQFNADGTPDTSFGQGSLASTYLTGADYFYVTGLAMQADGKPLLAATEEPPSSSPDAHANTFITRFDAGGAIDTSFGDGGAANQAGGQIALQPDGKIVTSGIACYLPDGTPDPTFGNNGRASVPTQGSYIFVPGAFAVGPDGSLAASIAGGNDVGGSEVALATFGPSGDLRASLINNNGSADLPYFSALALAPDGKIVTVGNESPVGSYVPYAVGVRRYNADLTPDLTFAPPPAAAAQGEVDSVALESDGKVVVGGIFGPAGSPRSLGLLRYNPDRTLDTTFGTGGLASIASSAGEAAQYLAIAPNGRIYVGFVDGAAAVAAQPHPFAVARFTPDGMPDPSFGTGGITIVSPGDTSYLAGVSLAPDGKLYAAGSVTLADGRSQAILARVLT